VKSDRLLKTVAEPSRLGGDPVNLSSLAFHFSLFAPPPLTALQTRGQQLQAGSVAGYFFENLLALLVIEGSSG
jgi:hypothetical protein